MTTLGNPATAPAGVVAIVRLRTAPPDAIRTALEDAGVPALEITLTTPGAEAAIARWRAAGGAAAVGAGTVRTPDEARRAVRAGAQFLVTPTTSAAVLETAGEAGVPVLCGALTPTEIDTAWRLGAAAVKVFPVDAVGGPAYVRAVQAPLPDIPLVPTGGVDAAAARSYAALGCHAVGVGGHLVSDRVTATGDFDGLRARAAALTGAWQAGAAQHAGGTP
ncbi:bifunctional 4-hydroxy-2-oxoglutarate aldolase/2-dehydro-3-deoxy-phosphogluconate aldolase [Streptomyces sp. DSM 44915]|uniref:Bifunctional 4-hydroxy-2-oxoglutarate aldolase/2-dehydro-3-deoxy-phosphogluconate aldolase n=1 Tax=Streptomyces chisholmiae TaxID=3075540 RepID=A0ABU2JUG6_9ACTN|nr:bifunctional 4-hydroxy-2-oxoglutarate aldolase/2-dehydro-3-deoxy-phosphogluconate aldolase [Streptomyces sp. DSM 44915]MDT0268623.1 bifunctional 4-hydroxy-2-oxoglutarate aldolase/2-dehydro-3-deoxy-phosphogluconate aldolase [Streptomyces sp. DSM 44915]